MPFSAQSLEQILREAIRNDSELPWIELKANVHNYEEIGEYISALSNTAALFNQTKALMIWGIDDSTHQIVGTTFRPFKDTIKGQNISLYFATQLNPHVQFYFHELRVDDHDIVLLEIIPAYSSPVKYRDVDYIRIDTCKKKLKDFPDTERELWAMFSKSPFESLIAMENVSGDLLLRLLDYPAYFDLLLLDLPSNKAGILESLLADGMISRNPTGNFNITNLGAILFAKKLPDFDSLSRKALRVIKYVGNSRMSAVKEQIGMKGYANGFEGLIDFVNNLLPHNEVMGAALRKDVPMYPELAIRELVANAIIHQNFFITGTGPMIEIFDDRMEITNPGTPLIDKERFIDYPPVSRNEKLASFMRRIGICEERGSGFDKIVHQTELYQLPAPEIELFSNNTRVTLFAHKTYTQMSKEDRQRTCYMHACLKKVNHEYVTNASLRERFKIDAKNSAMISRLLNETCEVGLIKPTEDSTSDRTRKYIPYWA